MRGHSSSPPGYTNPPTNQPTHPPHPSGNPYSTFSYFPLLMILVKVVLFNMKVFCANSYFSSEPSHRRPRWPLEAASDNRPEVPTTGLFFKRNYWKRKKLASAVKLSSDAGSKARDVNLPTATHSTSQGSHISQLNFQHSANMPNISAKKSANLSLRFGQHIIPQSSSTGAVL